MDQIISWARTILSTTPMRWKSLTETLPEELLRRPPAEGEWSALECLQHLFEAEQQIFPVRVQHFMAGRDFPAFDPDSEGTQPDPDISPKELADAFAQLRSKSLDDLRNIQPVDLERRARHSELGEVTLGEMLHEWAAHDLMHTVQAERAIMQPFIQGAGPWQIYFKDHQVE